MMLELLQHKSDELKPAIRFTAGLEQKQNKLILDYQIIGQIKDLILPEPKKQIKRLDNLWQNSCFEAFFRLKDSGKYIELNLSPFSAYNAYIFDSYRRGMREYDIGLPGLSAEKEANSYRFQAQIDGFEVENYYEYSLAAILKLKGGQISHWAIKQVSDKPDFHLFESFLKL